MEVLKEQCISGASLAADVWPKAGVSISFPKVQLRTPMSMGKVESDAKPAPIQKGKARTDHHRIATSFGFRSIRSFASGNGGSRFARRLRSARLKLQSPSLLAPSLLIIQVMNEVHPSARQRLMHDVVVVSVKRLAEVPVLTLSHCGTLPALRVLTRARQSSDISDS
jgi:hypothetical protein